MSAALSDRLRPGVEAAPWVIEEVRRLERELAAKQARIDELMQEYCPEEMTPEQLSAWERHQALSPLSLEAREWIEAELAKGGGAA